MKTTKIIDTFRMYQELIKGVGDLLPVHHIFWTSLIAESTVSHILKDGYETNAISGGSLIE